VAISEMLFSFKFYLSFCIYYMLYRVSTFLSELLKGSSIMAEQNSNGRPDHGMHNNSGGMGPGGPGVPGGMGHKGSGQGGPGNGGPGHGRHGRPGNFNDGTSDRPERPDFATDSQLASHEEGNFQTPPPPPINNESDTSSSSSNTTTTGILSGLAGLGVGAVAGTIISNVISNKNDSEDSASDNNNVTAEQDAAHRDEDIRDVEDRKLGEEVQLEHILHKAVQETVDAVADAAGHDEHGAPAAKLAADDAGRQQDDHGDGEHAADGDQIPLGVGTGQEAEGSALVTHVHQAHEPGDQRLGAGVENDVPGDPVLRPLVEDDDQKGNDGIQHIFLLSAAKDLRRYHLPVFSLRRGIS